MSRRGVTDTDLGWGRIKRTMSRLSGSYTKVGLQQGSQRNDEGGLSSLVTVGAVHEFGAPNRNIPQRSFLRSAFDQHRREIDQVLAKEKGAILAGTRTIEQSLDVVGLLHTAQVQAKISSNVPPHLAAATIEKKGSSRTLIDTRQLVQSIRHVNVVKK